MKRGEALSSQQERGGLKGSVETRGLWLKRGLGTVKSQRTTRLTAKRRGKVAVILLSATFLGDPGAGGPRNVNAGFKSPGVGGMVGGGGSSQIARKENQLTTECENWFRKPWA